MFAGHYAPGFLARRLEPGLPLWVLFLAVQLLDVFWALFVFAGIERVRIVPGFTATNPLDLYYMPYTHSLPGAIAWSVAAALAWRLASGGRRGAVLVGAAVFSHWPLDLLVHRPDLALYDDSAKVGLGLWDYPFVTLALEGALLFGAMALYLARSRPRPGRAGYSMPVMAAVVLALQAGMLFTPPPPSDRAMAATALLSYVVLTAVIAWLEKGRVDEAPAPA